MERLTVEEAQKLFAEKAPRASKYGNRKIEYGGRTFDSKLEADYAAELDRLRKATDPAERVVSVEYQVRFPILVNAVKICDYLADFVVTYGDGRTAVIDAKGIKTDVYKLKRKLMKAVHDIDIEEV